MSCAVFSPTDGPREGQEMDKRKNKFRWSKIWKQKNKNKAKE